MLVFSGLDSKKKEVDRYWILIVWFFLGLVFVSLDGFLNWTLDVWTMIDKLSINFWYKYNCGFVMIIEQNCLFILRWYLLYSS